MKKIIFLFLFVFLLSGCFDYVELNELSIITMIIIDKKDDKYNISFEILNDQKVEGKNCINESIIVEGNGKTLTEAITNATSKTPKQAYLAHLKILAISKDIAKDNLKEVISYFLRAPHIRNEFYLTLVDSNKASDILNVSRDEIPIISDYISSMLKDNKKSYNNVTNNNFENIIIDIFTKGKDAIIPVIKMDDKQIKAEGNALFSKYSLKEILNTEDSSLLNVLSNNSSNTIFVFNCPNSNDKISLTLYSGKTKIDTYNQTVKINSKLMAEIEEYNCKDNLKDINTYKDYNKYYENEFKKKILDLYKKLQLFNTDVLGVGNKLYIKRRYYKKDNWLFLNPSIKVDLKINKEGLIYEVTNGN